MSALKLTLEELKKQITSKSTVYYSSGNLWWTHMDDDLKQSTEMGLASQKKSHQTFMDNPANPQDAKDRLQSLMTGLEKHHQKHGFGSPLDPYGCPLMHINANKYISAAENKPEHFGKYGLEAFMKVHHHNDILKSMPFMNWKDVTDRLDGYYSVANRVKKSNATSEESKEWQGSSIIGKTVYYKSAGTLKIYFTSGKCYNYFQFPVTEWEALKKTDSIGKFFNTNIRDKYKSEGVI